MPSQSGDDVVIIKKYANRRLYNTETSAYVTLEHLAEMVRAKREFKVVDAKSGEDITHAVLTQIIMEQECGDNPMLPVNFLRQLIGMYGGAMQPMMPQFLEESLAAFQRNQAQLRDAMAGAFSGGPFAEMARRNMEMFAAAAGGTKTEQQASAKGEKGEIDELRAQLKAMQDRLDRLGG